MTHQGEISPKDILANLKKSEFFNHLSEREMTELSTIMDVITVSEGTVLIREGSPSDYAYFLVEGELETIRKYSTDNKLDKHIIGSIQQGEIFGEIALIDNQPRSASVKAKTEAVLYRASRDDLMKLRDYELVLDVAKLISKRMRKANDALTDAMQKEISYQEILNSKSYFLIYALLMMAFYSLSTAFIAHYATNKVLLTFMNSIMIIVINIFALRLMKNMHFEPAHYGLTWKNWLPNTVESILISGVFIVAMTLAKYAVVHFFGIGDKVFDFTSAMPHMKVGSPDYFSTLILLIVVYSILSPAQELLGRGIVVTALQEFIQGPNSKWLAIIISSFLFAALHSHLSPIIATLVFIPSLLWGWMWTRQDSIIGVSISHILLGCYAFFVLGLNNF